jgi:uncharacterized protein (TIGR02118 family)
MVKLTFCLRRRPDLSPEEFSRYWREEHGPLVVARAEALGIRRYQQVHTVDEPQLHAALQARNGGAPPPYDGIAEVWVDSVQAFRSGSDETSRAAAAELLADERNFIDLPNSPMWLGVEHELVNQLDGYSAG